LGVDILLWKIDPSLKVSERFQQLVTGGGGAFAERSLKLTAGGPKRRACDAAAALFAGLAPEHQSLARRAVATIR
jgi:hypothetical protein